MLRSLVGSEMYIRDRIAIVLVEAAHDRMHPPPALQGLEPDMAVAHHQIGPLDQRKIQVAGQQRVPEVGIVVRTRGEQHRQLSLIQI